MRGCDLKSGVYTLLGGCISYWSEVPLSRSEIRHFHQMTQWTSGYQEVLLQLPHVGWQESDSLVFRPQDEHCWRRLGMLPKKNLHFVIYCLYAIRQMRRFFQNSIFLFLQMPPPVQCRPGHVPPSSLPHSCHHCSRSRPPLLQDQERDHIFIHGSFEDNDTEDCPAHAYNEVNVVKVGQPLVLYHFLLWDCENWRILAVKYYYVGRDKPMRQ